MLRPQSAIFAALLLLASAAPALAHAWPKVMDPAPNSTVDMAPRKVVIDFTEALIANFSSLEVVDSAGKRVDRNDAHLAANNDKEYIVYLASLTPGTYKVIWHATSVDTHKTHGSYEFTVSN